MSCRNLPALIGRQEAQKMPDNNYKTCQTGVLCCLGLRPVLESMRSQRPGCRGLVAFKQVGQHIFGVDMHKGLRELKRVKVVVVGVHKTKRQELSDAQWRGFAWRCPACDSSLPRGSQLQAHGHVPLYISTRTPGTKTYTCKRELGELQNLLYYSNGIFCFG